LRRLKLVSYVDTQAKVEAVGQVDVEAVEQVDEVEER
jgi:hypothetical protein